MKKKTNTIYIIVQLILLAAGAVLTGISMFGADSDAWHLTAALACIFLANTIGVVRVQKDKNSRSKRS